MATLTSLLEERPFPSAKATIRTYLLSCGHTYCNIYLIAQEEVVGSTIDCFRCKLEALQAEMTARSPSPLEVFPTEEALRAKHPGGLPWSSYGPVLQYGEHKYAQTYEGGHVWALYRVDDPRISYRDPGYQGDQFGWAYVPEEYVRYSYQIDPSELGLAPISSGPVITADQILFGR